MSMALFSSAPPQAYLPSIFPPQSTTTKYPQLAVKFGLSLRPKKKSLLLVSTWATHNGSGAAAVTVEEEDKAAVAEEKKVAEAPVKSEESKVESLESNGSSPVTAAAAAAAAPVEVKFEDPRWVNGTWNLKQFLKDGKTNWDDVIDAEARRRKWLQDDPESSSNEDPIVFDTSIIPWWAWIKRYHLPEAELLNGRAAMIGFFMAYLVDSLTGVGLVDQMSNFFCKTLLFIAVVGVLLIRKNEDIETVKKLLEESTFYDKQWQATWQDEKSSSSKDD